MNCMPLSVGGSMRIYCDFVLLAGPDPAVIFLAWLQALHRNTSSLAGFQVPHPQHEEVIDIFICICIIMRNVRMCCIIIFDRVHGNAYTEKHECFIQ